METLFQELEHMAAAHMPCGFRYHEDFIPPEQETLLAAGLASLDLRPFEFHGYLGNRRVASFGYRYDFSKQTVEAVHGIPDFLLALREKVGAFTGRNADEFEQVGIQQYAPGAGVGWHKDRPQFGEVVGVSLLATAPMRLRRKDGSRWQRATQVVAPRSVYLLSDAARSEWEHSIPPMGELRYSITFRTFAPGFVRPTSVAR